MKIESVEFVKGAARWDDLVGDGLPEVAFMGRSNVGKSSLLNMLVQQPGMARTSGKPGKTQQFNYFLINNRLYFVDLPGYGYAKISRAERERWGRFIGRYLTERATLQLVFHLIDSRHPPQQQDEDVMGIMRGSPVPYVIALTKTDKLSGNERVKSIRRVESRLEEMAREAPVIATSAKTQRGRTEMLDWVEAVAAQPW